MHTKLLFTKKLRLLLAGFLLFATFSIMVPGAVVYASDVSDNSAANQCQGDGSTCICSTDPNDKKTGPTDTSYYDPNCGRDPVFKNCTVDEAKNTYKCGEQELEDCDDYDKKSQGYQDCLAANDLFSRYVNPIIAVLSFMVGLAVTIGIMVGGYQYITSAGDPQKVAAGKRHIWSAIFALIVYLFLFALLNFLIPGGIL